MKQNFHVASDQPQRDNLKNLLWFWKFLRDSVGRHIHISYIDFCNSCKQSSYLMEIGAL